MPSWFWLNVPLMALIFAAVCGIPLWLVFRHPDSGPEAGPGGRARQHAGRADPAASGAGASRAAGTAQQPRTGPVLWPGRQPGLPESLLRGLVACPGCGLPADLLERFSMHSTEGPVDLVALTCLDGHYFRMPLDGLPAEAQQQLRAAEPSAQPSGLAFSRMPGRMGTVGEPSGGGSGSRAPSGAGTRQPLLPAGPAEDRQS